MVRRIGWLQTGIVRNNREADRQAYTEHIHSRHIGRTSSNRQCISFTRGRVARGLGAKSDSLTMLSAQSKPQVTQ
jgi:hypothetical protein